MDKPFTIVTLPLIFGILTSYYFQINFYIVFALFIILIGLCIFKIYKSKSNSFGILALFFLLGISLTIINSQSKLIHNVDKTMDYEGIIHEVLHKESDKEKYVVTINTINGNSIDEEKTILTLLGNKNLNLGDMISFHGILKIPMENTNPKLFNYRLSLLSEKIHTTISLKDYNVKVLDQDNKGFKYIIKEKFTEHVENLFDAHLREENSSLVKAIILGKSSYLEEEDILTYRNLGLAHILAVSGLHIGIISGFLIFLFSHLGIKRKINIILTLLIIWIYGFLIGFPPSILRSSIMFSILFYSQIIHEPYDSVNTLSFALFLLLLINPLWIFNLGFQLSFIATFSIIILSPKILQLFYPYVNKFTKTLSSLMGVLTGLLPIQGYYFNNIGILSILSNLIIVPLLSLSLLLGFSMVILSFLFNFLNHIIGFILDIILSFQFLIVKVLDKVPFNIIKIYSPAIIEIFIYYLIIFILLKIIDIGKFKINISKVIVLYLGILLLFNSIIMIQDKSIEIHFIDVGQGDCILIRSRSGNYLIDTGGNLLDSFDIGKNITLPYLEKHGVKSLKRVFITHFHEDHSKGLIHLLENIKIKNILGSYIPKESEIYEEILKSNISFRTLDSKNSLRLDENTDLKVLWPKDKNNVDYLSENNKSLVILLSYYDKNILFTGDMEKEVEEEIGKNINIDIDIIKVPHHGSKTSSTEKLLMKLRPKTGIISVGRNNFYNHPSEEVLDRYENINTQILRTDESGLIKVVLSKDKQLIESYVDKKEKKDLFSFIYDNIGILSYYILYLILSYILVKISINNERSI